MSVLLKSAATLMLATQVSGAGEKGLGDGLWRTFAHQTALPLTAAAATADNWVAVTSCNPNLGILYAQDKEGPSEKHPLGLYFNAAGQLSGVQTTVFGTDKKAGPAAQQNLVDLGYWKPTANANETWHMDVSFRAPASMCATTGDTFLTGDRVVINQDTIKQSIPLTAQQARDELWTAGSCMASMGQHHFYDLKAAPAQSYARDQLLPLVPMYYPADSTGTLNAFFFTTPVAQPGSSNWYLLTGAADWESPDLNSKMMCMNYCDDENCEFDNHWATMHIYLDSVWESLTCPGGSGVIGRSCDL